MNPNLSKLFAGLTVLIAAAPILAGDAAEFGKMEANVLTKEQRDNARGMIDRYVKRHTDEANARNRQEWLKVKTREQWEKFRDERMERLRRSLGEAPQAGKLNSRITGVIDGDGFKIEKVVYESRPGQWVTGNLYVPARPGQAMPGILIAHAHHRDKPQAELQDMGMTWARAGCMVLVIDQVGYGERRSHPFHSAADYAKAFKETRQDYYFRYDTGIQLQLVGDSLMGWMVWDLMRGVDLLLARDGIDAKRIIILGAVAGGGDPAAVTAALDRRIAGCVPFNFGGPQPETRLPASPEEADAVYNFMGWTYWDSTRGLRLGARDEFFPWIIVASMAPRQVIHAHEFAWDRERDPVWKRYQKIWGEFYGAGDQLGFTHGKGNVKQSAAEATHCTNIGKVHRRMIHPLFEKWYGIKVTEADEYSAPRKRDELTCMTDKARQELKPKSLNELMTGLAEERIARARARLAGKPAAQRRQTLRADWTRLLGPVTAKPPLVVSRQTDGLPVDGAKIERIVLEVEPGIVVPILVLTPAKQVGPAPVVIGLAQAGKAGFLKERAAELHKLIQAGVIVVLPDVRGTGETRSGDTRGKASGDTNHAVYLQLFGETALGQRLRDLRSVLTYVRQRPDVDGKRLGLWGDSFAPRNEPQTNFKVPREVDGWPRQSEPLGGLLALLGTLFEDDVRAVHVSGGLASYQAVLSHFAVLIPHDASVPGALSAGDLCDLAGSLAPRPLRFEMMVDHLNRTVPAADLRKAYESTVAAYGPAGRVAFVDVRSSAGTWLVEQLK